MTSYCDIQFGLHITAEGVEKAEQVDFLKTLDCDNIQGFFYSKPMKEEFFQEKLVEEKISDAYIYRKGQKITYAMIVDGLRAGRIIMDIWLFR